MKNVTRLPKFMPGQVIDLSYKNKGLPNRILIKTAYVTEQSDGWMYEVYLENTGEFSRINEEFISTNMTHKASAVYKCKEIIGLYGSGWRFCGNFDKSTAHTIAGKHATNRYINNIMLRPALKPDGSLLNDYYGMWIKYHNIINDDGTIINSDVTNTDIIVIK